MYSSIQQKDIMRLVDRLNNYLFGKIIKSSRKIRRNMLMEKTIDTFRIAQNIRNLRQSKKLTQMEMAELLGYSERQVRRLETEGTMNICVINLIAQTFKISALDILLSGMF